MSRKRSKYRPKPKLTNPLAPMMPMGKERAMQIMLAYYTALGEIAAGRHPGRKEWCDLADCCNVVERLVRRGDFAEADVMPILDVAVDAMRDAAKEFETSGRLRLPIAAHSAMQRLLELHQDFLAEFPEREVLLVIAETRVDIAEARRHKDVVTL